MQHMALVVLEQFWLRMRATQHLENRALYNIDADIHHGMPCSFLSWLFSCAGLGILGRRSLGTVPLRTCIDGAESIL
jgi:hypothetical protein